jgi:tetratricopeptide (TPR) repeat protein
MEQHLSSSTLARVFSGQAVRSEVDSAVSHLAFCLRCLDLAGRVIEELKEARAEEERVAENRLRAGARWAELTGLSPEQQIERIKVEGDLQTREMFDTVLKQASTLAPNDPYLGEETARVAYALAGNLPKGDYSEAVRNDLQGEALGVTGNCRRLAADWRGSAQAFKAAQRHLERGTGEPGREARLLSIQASLATDTGHMEQAEALLARASALYRKAGDTAALASVTVKEANILLAACRHEQAIDRAQEALRLLTPKDTRLEILARNIITASLVFLERPAAAFKSYRATRSPCEQVSDRRSELQAEYLEALLLETLGYAREAEKTFRSNIAKRMEAELYKDAFLTMLIRFELLFRRGELDKAAQACEEALEMMQQAGVACHSQMEDLWRNLLTLVNARRLTEHHLLIARRYLLRHWNAPARVFRLEAAGGSTGIAKLPSSGTQHDHGLPTPVQASPPAAGNSGDVYEAALERYDRALIAKGLVQCGGRIAETSRLLDIARNTLRARITEYRLDIGIPEANSSAEGPGPAVLLEKEDREELERVRARTLWRELSSLTHAEQMVRIKGVRTLRTREMVDVILEAASASGLTDPQRGEEIAFVAYALAGILPPSRCPEPVKHDLQSKALGVAANWRRLAGDWQGSASAFSSARNHLARGTADPEREARLLSIQATLATDMGHHEEALALLARASAIYRSAQDDAGVALTKVKEANALLAACRHEEAVGRAVEALGLLPPKQTRLEILARNIITASLVFLGRPAEALRSLIAALPLAELVGGARAELHSSYLEALVLEALGFDREAETAFNANISTRMEAGLYKDAFLTMLARFELLFKRGDWAKAARVCEDAIERMKEAGEDRHTQTIQLWRDLLALVDARRLTDLHLLEARHALVRCWASPGQQGTALAAAAQPVEQPGPATDSQQARRLLTAEPPPLPARLEPGEYKEVLECYDRQLIAEGLARCRGHIGETCQLLGISRNTLRERMSRYGLK